MPTLPTFFLVLSFDPRPSIGLSSLRHGWSRLDEDQDVDGVGENNATHVGQDGRVTRLKKKDISGVSEFLHVVAIFGQYYLYCFKL